MLTKDTVAGVRLPLHLKQQWQKQAKEEGISLSSWIVKQISCEDKTKSSSLVQSQNVLSTGTIQEREKIDVKIRLFPSELKALDEQAKFLGFSRQAVLIKLIRNFLLAEGLVSNAELKELVEANKELRKIGVNLNQIAKQVNSALKLGCLELDDVQDVKRVITILDDRLKNQIETNHKFLLTCNNRNKISVNVVTCR